MTLNQFKEDRSKAACTSTLLGFRVHLQCSKSGVSKIRLIDWVWLMGQWAGSNPAHTAGSTGHWTTHVCCMKHRGLAWACVLPTVHRWHAAQGIWDMGCLQHRGQLTCHEQCMSHTSPRGWHMQRAATTWHRGVQSSPEAGLETPLLVCPETSPARYGGLSRSHLTFTYEERALNSLTCKDTPAPPG